MTALLQQALDALTESVDLVADVHADAVELYSRYPSRQAKIAGLKSDLDAHQAAIAAITAELAGAQAPKQTLIEWAGAATPEQLERGDWRIVCAGLRQAKQLFLDAQLGNQSWLNCYIQIAESRGKEPDAELAGAQPVQPTPVPVAVGVLGYRYSRNNGKNWHLCEDDPTHLMPDTGGIVLPLVAAILASKPGDPT